MAEAPEHRTPPDFSRPSPARVHHYWLEGSNCFQADRDLADELERACPALPGVVRAHRSLMLRGARWAAAVKGISQFAHVGAGLPATPSVHRTVQDVNPEARVCYVDKSTEVVRVCQAMQLKEHWEGTAVLGADPADPDAALAALRGFIDFTEPAGLLIGSALASMPAAGAAEVVSAYARALAPGSALVVFTVTYVDPGLAQRQAERFAGAGAWHNHQLEDVQGFFSAAGLQMWPMVPAGNGHPVQVTGGVAFKGSLL